MTAPPMKRIAAPSMTITSSSLPRTLPPCDTDCEVSEGDYDRAEALLKSGRHDAKILWGRKKKANYYYAFVPRNSDAAAMLTKGLFEKFIGFGECTEKRKLPY